MTQTHPHDRPHPHPHASPTATDPHAHARIATPREVRRHIVPGLIAGALFLALEMLIGSFTTTPWAFPEAVAHTLHIGTPGYRFEPSALAIGACVHLAVSAALGALFTLIVDRLRITGTRVVIAAWLFSGTETAIAIWGVLHTFLPATLQQFLDSIPLWASILGHNVYGLALGLLLLRHDRGHRHVDELVSLLPVE